MSISIKTWSVYIVKCLDNSIYTGVSNNISQRIKKHINGTGSKYVKSRGFSELIAQKECLNKSDAHKKEYLIKQLPKDKKVDWFRSNP